MRFHAASCYQSNLDHLWTTKDDAFRDVISACERCGESNEAPKCLFLFFLFLSSTCPWKPVCWLPYVDLFCTCLIICTPICFCFLLFKPFVDSGLAFVQPAAKFFSSPREWHLCSGNPSVWRGGENHGTCSHNHTVFTVRHEKTWSMQIKHCEFSCSQLIKLMASRAVFSPRFKVRLLPKD